MAGHQAEDSDPRSLWFIPPDDGESSRPTLTRERVVAEALTVISMDGAQALSMRGLARRLGVVPGALYRHVRSKEQLHDLVLDAVLAEVDCRADPALPSIAQVAVLAHRLRAILEDHPGIAALLKTRDPVSPASLALAEAFLAALHAAGLPAARPPWPSASSTTTPSALPWPAPPRPPSDAFATARPDSNCTHSSAPCRPAASLPWPRTAPTPGPTTARNASPRASTP
jgi:AcrR family transcriptional regulator